MTGTTYCAVVRHQILIILIYLLYTLYVNCGRSHSAMKNEEFFMSNISRHIIPIKYLYFIVLTVQFCIYFAQSTFFCIHNYCVLLKYLKTKLIKTHAGLENLCSIIYSFFTSSCFEASFYSLQFYCKIHMPCLQLLF